MSDQTVTDHWLNGFLRQNCEEARKRLQEERNLWSFTDSENEDLDLPGIFNFINQDESNGLNGEDILLPLTTVESVHLDETKPAQFKDGILLHGIEQQTQHDCNSSSEADDISIAEKRQTFLDNRQNDTPELQSESRDARQSLESRPPAQRSALPSGEASIDDVEKPIEHDNGRWTSLDKVTSESSKAKWDFETELVEVPVMGIVHAKQQLQDALNDFNSNVVQRERLGFQQTMKQIEETVNEILEEVERLDSSFKLRRMNRDSYYEMKSWNEVDILIVLDNVSLDEFVIEDMKTPTGYARIRLKTSSNVSTSKETSVHGLPSASSHVTSEAIITSSHPLFHWCTETKPGEICLSPKKLCKAFAELVSRAARRVFRNGSSVNRKRVSFVNEEASVPFTVNLLPTLACPHNWPLCAYWFKNYTKKWPAVKVKDDVLLGGMHLVAVVTNKESDILWEISFCGARRHLLRSDCDGKKTCLRVLKVLLKNDLSRPKGLVPQHLENIVLWASKKHWQQEEWAEAKLSERVLEMLVALQKCLENRDCYNFFVPTMNLFNDLKPEVVKMLAVKVKDVLLDPCKYLKN